MAPCKQKQGIAMASDGKIQYFPLEVLFTNITQRTNNISKLNILLLWDCSTKKITTLKIGMDVVEIYSLS